MQILAWWQVSLSITATFVMFWLSYTLLSTAVPIENYIVKLGFKYLVHHHIPSRKVTRPLH